MKIERIEKIANNMKDIDGKVLANELVERLNSSSFWELLTEMTKIQIPIIQRDFAQGRENEKTNKIRSLFLESIIEAVESEKGSLELDFVYGNVEKDVFQPLDGQQRLTTLFLLHWYIALKTGELPNTKKHFIKFTYETRISSREFCNELVDNGEFLGIGEKISEKIYDSKWFFLSWKKDPTIKAMLVMLDAIEERLLSKNDEELKIFWQKLTSENPPILFHFKQLNDIGLTDDLYIKMNARGKGLTDFENFKAKFEKHIKKNVFEKELELSENNKEKWKELTEKTFSHRIDTVWTDLFWKHRGEDNIIDNEMIKFIAGIAINNYAQNLEILENSEDELRTRKILEEKKEKNITDEAVKRERIERRITALFNNPADVSPYDFPTKESFEYLKKCFDVYSKNQNDELLPANVTLWDFCKTKKVKINSDTEIDNNLFIEFIKKNETTYSQRVLFYAQTQYLVNLENFDSESFSNWLRVVRNIVQNATIDSAYAFIGAIGLINELSSGCENIYEFLSSTTLKSGFATKQIEEEKLKAALIKSDNNWKSQIFKAEDDIFLKGEIKFLLDFSKVGEEYKIQEFTSISDKFLLLFESKDDLLRKALLTQDDYPVWDGRTSSLGWAHRYSLLNTENEWKDAFRKKSDKFINAVYKLISNSFNLSDDRITILKNVIQNATPLNDYRSHLIKNDSLLRDCYHKRICLNEKKTILYVLEKTRVVGENYKEIKV
ncbi:MAG: DUF262 domain-containing protein [Tenuifilum sp.]|uniref:GmrSD restriction endonuclease domain-containing protein n=1 Tax=Tenuifilum sp. TaxID=2760880 RepID=UPI001B551788|nr:DUF262 domain-containing protein [Bacteroidales bacterium]HOK60416.1 DUF262 domain-containing protein [Tenuifilum sp.]HOK85746.1 DUF262 domain-containing protein [Tenuifilum sp.]HON70592.1 DUF262 domain-containing protein [Tenuifilum sp.]HOU73953.1 DUF262 domain-containing protein [Tenuifilum sp.]